MLGAQNAGIDSLWYCPQALRYHPEWEEEAQRLSITYRAGSFEEIRQLLLYAAGNSLSFADKKRHPPEE